MFLLLPIAFVSGILTVFSPCVLPILPIILASGIDGNKKRIRGLIFGLILSFTIASLLLATFVRVFGIPADIVRNFAVVLLIIFGISMVFPVIWDKIQVWIEMHWKFQPIQSDKNSGYLGGFVTGVSLGIVWTPCIGPILAAVATLAAVSTFSAATLFISLAYAIGAGIPLYFIARGGSKVAQRLGFIKKENKLIRRIFGVIIIITAMFIYFGADRWLQAWTLRNLPESWVNITATFEDRLDVDTQLNNLKKDDKINKAKPGDEVINKVSLQNDFTGAKIDKNDLIQGCFRQDCIPSIDNPVFESVAEADSWLEPTDRIFALNYKGETRAYPQRIMNWHEIVNDRVQDDPIAITFCPLCGSAVAFERKVDGVITQLGVSGKLHDNDLVMYDRYEGNLWQQITGEGIVGPAARRDEVLTQVPIITVEWSDWKKEHPDTKVLSRDTGNSRNYDQYPYGAYEENDELLFGIKELNKTLQIKTPVYGIEVGSASKAYPVEVFKANPIIEDQIGGVNIKLEKIADGSVKVVNLDTNEEIIPIRLFWFAWASFHPETELYEDF